MLKGLLYQAYFNIKHEIRQLVLKNILSTVKDEGKSKLWDNFIWVGYTLFYFRYYFKYPVSRLQ